MPGNIANAGMSQGGTLTIISSGGPGSVIFSGNNIYSGPVSVDSGAMLLAGSTTGLSPNSAFTVTGVLQLAGYSNTILSLSGSGTVSDSSANAATLTIAPTSGMTTFSGVIQDGVGGGELSLVKLGAGTQSLSGADTYSGPTTVSAGTVYADGSIANSAFTVNSSATLGGYGTIGALSALPGSTIAPGAQKPYSTLTVVNNATFAAGSTYGVNVNAAGATDKLAIGGVATLSGGAVAVNAASGSFGPTNSYVILTATGGVSGTFSNVSTNLAFLSPTLAYPTDEVVLTLARNVVPFPSVAGTPNEVAAGTTIQALGPGNTIYNAMLGLTAAQADAAFNSASGEIHASAESAALDDTRLPREAILDRLDTPDGALDEKAFRANGFVATTAPVAPSSRASQGYTAWGRGFGDFGHIGGNGNAASLDRSLGGFVAGIDTDAIPNVRIGVATAYAQSNISVSGRSSSGTIQSASGGLYASYENGGLRLRGGVLASSETFMTSRTVTAGVFSDSDQVTYGGEIVQGFGELGWRFALANKTSVEPFVGSLAMSLHTNAYAETGGAAALTGLPQTDNVQATTLGLRYDYAPFADLPILTNGAIGWRHGFGDIDPSVVLAFASATGNHFVSQGAPLARDALITEFGLDWRLNKQAILGVFYSGELAAHKSDDALEAKFEVTF